MRPSVPQLHRCNATRRQVLTEEARELAAVGVDVRRIGTAAAKHNGKGMHAAVLPRVAQHVVNVVVSVVPSDEDAFVMSLAENIARRKCSPLELLAGIGRLQEQGYDKKAIAEKTGLTLDYVHGILQLLSSGEERLLVAVESGRIPLTAALVISGVGSQIN